MFYICIKLWTEVTCLCTTVSEPPAVGCYALAWNVLLLSFTIIIIIIIIIINIIIIYFCII